jgi:hypothetical protein
MEVTVLTRSLWDEEIDDEQQSNVTPLSVDGRKPDIGIVVVHDLQCQRTKELTDCPPVY